MEEQMYKNWLSIILTRNYETRLMDCDKLNFVDGGVAEMTICQPLWHPKNISKSAYVCVWVITRQATPAFGARLDIEVHSSVQRKDHYTNSSFWEPDIFNAKMLELLLVG